MAPVPLLRTDPHAWNWDQSRSPQGLPGREEGSSNAYPACVKVNTVFSG